MDKRAGDITFADHAAATALGADLTRLERALTGDADAGAGDARTGSGLREDQAAAVLAVPTDGRRVSVINAPAGAGKTPVLAEPRQSLAASGTSRDPLLRIHLMWAR